MLYRVSYQNMGAPPVTIEAPTAKDAATIFYFKHPDHRSFTVETVAADGTAERFTLDDIALSLPADVPNGSQIVASLSKRYKDAYTEAHTVVTVGKFIKGLGVFLFIVVLLAGFAMGSDRGGGAQAALIGFLLACLLGIPVFVLGILVAAQGQTQLATLDTAVNTSRHLTNDEVAEILTKRFSL